MALGKRPKVWVTGPGVPKLVQKEEIWLSRDEINGLLQGSLTWADLCSRPARPVRLHESTVTGEGAGEEDFVLKEIQGAQEAQEVKITGYLAATAVLTLVSWVYFAFAV